MPPARTDDLSKFVSQGMEYYLAGRFAFLQHAHIAANLFHHGVELLLKYALLRDAHEGAAPPNYGHDLRRLWRDFKARDQSRASLARFDGVVADLDDWEHIRYPGFRRSQISGRAVAQAMTLLPYGRGAYADFGGREVDAYVLCLEDIDDLVSSIVTAASINPKVLLIHLSPDAVDWYHRENRHRMELRRHP